MENGEIRGAGLGRVDRGWAQGGVRVRGGRRGGERASRARARERERDVWCSARSFRRACT
jgi:hypothetical protein